MHRRRDGRDPDGPGRPLSHPLRPAPERGAEPGAGVPAGGNAEPGNDRAGAAGGVRQQALVLEPRLSPGRSEENTSELQSLMRISYAVFCFKRKTRERVQKQPNTNPQPNTTHASTTHENSNEITQTQNNTIS